MTGASRSALSGLARLAVWLLLWQIAASLSGKEAWRFVPPAPVLRALAHGLGDGSMLRGVAASLARVAAAFALAIALGTASGVLLTVSSTAAWLAGPLLSGVQSLPSICWMPLAILWLGLNERAILFVALMGSVGSIAMATRDGLASVPLAYQRVAATFGATRWQRLALVQMPAAVPAFVAGLKQGWSFAWRSLLAGELLYRCTSAGSLLTDARDLADYPRLFAVMALLMAVSVAVDRLVFSPLEADVRRRWALAPR